MRVTLIHNPSAGRKGGDVARLAEAIRAAGHELLAKSCKDDGWEEALDAPADLVAVSGGDGTISRLAKRLAGRGVPLAPIPAGTANNIATSLGLVGRPLEALVRGWASARAMKLDLGVAKGPWGERYFVEGFGVGLFANTFPVLDEKLARNGVKKPREKVKFAQQRILGRLASTRAVSLKASLDGEDVSGEYLLFEALNIPHVGPNLFLAPDSKPGDGRFDLVMASEAERDRLSHYLETWQDEKSRLAVLPTRKGSRLTLSWTGYRVHVDDEFWPEDDARRARSGDIELTISGAVEFLVPGEA